MKIAHLSLILIILLASSHKILAKDANYSNGFSYTDKSVFETMDPYQEIEILKKRVSNIFDNALQTTIVEKYGHSPALDLRDEGDSFTAKIDLPGFDKESIDIKILDRTLSISAKKETTLVESDNKEKFLKKERHGDSLQRLVELPSEVDEKLTKASYKNGVLEIVMPKITPIKQSPIQIEIQ